MILGVKEHAMLVWKQCRFLWDDWWIVLGISCTSGYDNIDKILNFKILRNFVNKPQLLSFNQKVKQTY